ncbi:AraC family transcriptional regulator [Streptomyces sp. NPDC060006]|uniref:AraC family transcriptional regulator n=1 Tax=unclassified Streptomyces TaxID=2593676 RepID=UPI0036C2F6A6
MIGTVFRSDDVPVEDRFDYWCQLVHQAVAPSHITSDYAADFWAEQHMMKLGPVMVWPVSVLPTRFRRTEKLVRQSDPDMYHLSLVLGGGLGVEHIGRTDLYGPRDLWVTDTAKPYEVRPPDGARRPVKGVGVDFPKALMPVSPNRVRELLGRRLSGREATGALLTSFLTGLERESGSLRPADAPRLGVVLVDLLSAWFAQVLDAEDALSPETRHQTMVARIRAFVRQNLHDPDLTPPVIAAAHHISVSYLHRLFKDHAQGEGETVAAWVRTQRLEGARRDLADPALRTTPIHAVAARWGLPRASDFTRAFRTVYGLTPKEYRLQSLSSPEQAE